MVELCSSTSCDSLKIHQRLLESKSEVVAAAFQRDFPERHSRCYTFTETTHVTVSQFIEWAYSGDYTDVKPMPIDKPWEKQPGNPPEPTTLEPPDELSEESKVLPAHTLLSHLHVYVFSHVYQVSKLKELAFDKFTTVLKDMGKPTKLDEQLAVIDCLEVVFSKVDRYDGLRGWLAQYAAWCLDTLRLQGKFHGLLRRVPALSSRMMESLSPAKEAPWNTKSCNYRVPPYDTRTSFDEENGY
ncbi:hypothetical protein F1880_010292 [Penicillium rolfsii]|nr:hypothetical protein F1880_010292 [Penicillium rolfsii]